MHNERDYIAHRLEDGKTQPLKDHLLQVASAAERHSCGTVKKLAYLAGLLHDLGKYSEEFQQRIRGSALQTEHSLAGAQEAGRGNPSALLLQYVIAGHHSGLPDGGTAADSDDVATLSARLKRTADNYSAAKSEIEWDKPVQGELDGLLARLYKDCPHEATECFAFFTRYVFSCLTDADFLDTESFCSPGVRRGFNTDFAHALELVEQKLSSFVADTPVKKARSQLLEQVKQNIDAAADINILDMPTGSGKTLTGLWAALHIAKTQNKRRIIYVIPYTSIIEQTASEFKKIFGDSVTVLEHHSNYDFDGAETKAARESAASGGAAGAAVDSGSLKDSKRSGLAEEKLKRAAENWDCPIVVTTNVQLFESMYHYRSSRLRKLHNLSGSVLVFDEIHTLPLEYLQPCIRAVGQVTKHLDSKAIFLSATMPNFDGFIQQYAPGCSVKNLIYDKSSYARFKNCTISYIGEANPEKLALSASKHGSALIVAGTRNAAREIYKLLSGNKFHLSTYMTPVHRSEVIAKIKKLLAAGEKLTVVSTSLIEAGVDLDFEAVYRELAGLDNILQAAGRCNREGRRANGQVFVYQTERPPSADIQVKANVTLNLLGTHSDITSEKCIEEYFGRVYGFHSQKIQQNRIGGSAASPLPLSELPFRSYAQSFKFIDTLTIGVVIDNAEESGKLLQELEYGGLRAKRPLQRYTVGVRKYELDHMLKSGLLRQVNGVYVLSNNRYYSAEYGLATAETQDTDYMACKGE